MFKISIFISYLFQNPLHEMKNDLFSGQLLFHGKTIIHILHIGLTSTSKIISLCSHDTVTIQREIHALTVYLAGKYHKAETHVANGLLRYAFHTEPAMKSPLPPPSPPLHSNKTGFVGEDGGGEGGG
jgi:hypothetical protein